MDGWTYGWMDGLTDGRMANGLVEVWMDGWRHGRTDVDGKKAEEGNGRVVCR